MSSGTPGNPGPADHHGVGSPRTGAPRAEPRLLDLRRLLEEEPADPEAVREARRRKESALLDFRVGQSVVAS